MPNDAAAFLNQWGWMGIAILLILGGSLGLYVFGWQYKAMEAEAKFWRDLFLGQNDKNNKALDTLNDALQLAKEASYREGKQNTGRQ